MPELIVIQHALPSLALPAASRPSISASSASVSLCAESYAPSTSLQAHDSTASSTGPSDSNPHTPTHSSPRPHKLRSPEPSSSPRRIASKAADLLYGGHKSDGHGKKVYDLLGMTAKQYERVQHEQRTQHEHDAGAAKGAEESKEAADTLKPIEHIAPVAAGAGPGHKRANSRVVGQNKAMDLLHGGHKKESKVGDMLGVSKQEIEHFREVQKAYQKLGVGATQAAHDALPRDMHLHEQQQQQHTQAPTAASANANHVTSLTSPTSTSTHLVLSSPTSVSSLSSPTSLSSSSAQQQQHGNRRASISKKASDLLYGSNKSNSKLEDRLGVMEKELETFGRIPKAYQLMGVYDHRDIPQASKQQAAAAAAHAKPQPPQHRGAASQLLSPPTLAARAELSVSTLSMADRPSLLNRPVSLSMVPISPLSTFTAMPTVPLSPATRNSSRHKHSLDIPPLGSSRPSTGSASSRSLSSARSDSDTGGAPAALSPRSRRVILQPLTTPKSSVASAQWAALSPSGGKLSEVAEEGEDGTLTAAARVRARERASRLKGKVKMAAALSSWQQAAAANSPATGKGATGRAERLLRSPSNTAASSAQLFAPTAAAIQLGVSGRSVNRTAQAAASEGGQADESTVVSLLPSSSPASPPQFPQALRPLPARPSKRQQLSPVRVNRRSLLPGAVSEELASGGARRWGKVGAAVHVAAAMKGGLGGGAGGGGGESVRVRGESGLPVGKATAYVAPNYKV